MHINPYVQDLVLCRDYFRQSAGQEQDVTAVTTHLNVMTHRLEIGVLLNQDQSLPTIYQYRTQDNQNVFLRTDSDETEALLYPLLFPFGERGWGANLKRAGIQLMQYIAARMMQPELDLSYTNDTNEFHVNRFDVMARLSQYWLLDGILLLLVLSSNI